jgi:hypothetical protein
MCTEKRFVFNSDKEIPSRTRLQGMLRFARDRGLVSANVWKESPVTAKNPKRLQFRFQVNADSFARLQERQRAAAAAAANSAASGGERVQQ